MVGGEAVALCNAHMRVHLSIKPCVTVQSNGKDGHQMGQDVSKELMKNMEQGMRSIVRDEFQQQTRLGGILNPGGYN